MAKKTNEQVLYTVTDHEAAGKPIIHAELVSAEVLTDQEAAEKVIASYMTTTEDREVIEEVAYGARKHGYWFVDEQFCHEFTRLCKPGEIIGE